MLMYLFVGKAKGFTPEKWQKLRLDTSHNANVTSQHTQNANRNYIKKTR